MIKITTNSELKAGGRMIRINPPNRLRRFSRAGKWLRIIKNACGVLVLFLLGFPKVLANHVSGHVTDTSGGTVTDTPTFGLQNPIKYPDLQTFLMALLNIVVQYGALLVVFFLVYTGFKFVTAQGNTEKIQEAKQMLVWVVVGAFVLLGVYVIKAAICGTLQQISADPTKPLCAP